uniref:Uncharacterized protein n=1 Tax=Hyaloperonospora arabidopsidis (strain Emoy2) TaxID=559515 RepID=M4BI00_HYAAE
MGNVVCWLAQCWYPREQVFWVAVYYNSAYTIRSATSRLPLYETRQYLEWHDPLTGRTALLEAAVQGHGECARLLIEAGAKCNATDLQRDTPLHLACKGAKLEIVKLLLQVPAVNRFKVNWRGKTPLDVARSRFLEEGEKEREGVEAGAYAKCIDVLEKMFCVYSGLLYQKTDNMLSLVSGISSLNSWTRRFCLVLERGHPSVLELALFNIKDDDSMRPVCPTSVMLCYVAPGMKAVHDPRWFSPKDFTFVVQGDRLNNCHYGTNSAPENSIHFAAIDRAGFDAWRSFWSCQQQQLDGLLCPTVDPREQLTHFDARYHTRAAQDPSPRVLAYAASRMNGSSPVAPEPNDMFRARDRQSFRTMDQTGRTLYSISAARVPALAASAPDWESDESEPDGYAVSAASTRECRTGLKARFASGHGSTGVGTRNMLADAVAEHTFASLSSCTVHDLERLYRVI